MTCVGKNGIDKRSRTETPPASLHVLEKVVLMKECVLLIQVKEVRLHEVVEASFVRGYSGPLGDIDIGEGGVHELSSVERLQV